MADSLSAHRAQLLATTAETSPCLSSSGSIRYCLSNSSIDGEFHLATCVQKWPRARKPCP